MYTTFITSVFYIHINYQEVTGVDKDGTSTNSNSVVWKQNVLQPGAVLWNKLPCTIKETGSIKFLTFYKTYFVQELL